MLKISHLTKIIHPIGKMALSLLILLLALQTLFGQDTGSAGKTAFAPMLLSDLDIPLMPGFSEEDNSRLVFDTPEGRIIEVRVQGRHSQDQVAAFYRRVLPTLAWRIVSSHKINQREVRELCGARRGICLRARRDTEILTLAITTLEEDTVIYFSVHPE